jgi:3-oxoacyl-[acyl-carrier-protein] synthase II
MVSSLAYGARATFARLLEGARGFSPVSLFEVGDQRCTIAAEVQGLSVRDVAPVGEAELWSRTDALALLAAREAVDSAGCAATLHRTGIAVGGTTGGMFETECELLESPSSGIEFARAERLLSFPLSTTSERLAKAFGSVVRTATVCSACSSSAIALVQAAAWLRSGEVERVIAGGADGLCRLTYVGFNSLGATDPTPCRPFDRARGGLSLGEGAAFLVLENESTARARGAEILAFLSGSAVLAEAHHITNPEPSGRKAAELLQRALKSAELSPASVDYVNAHGTGTLQNDAMEAAALRQVFGELAVPVLVSSSKGQVGHTLGAAGAVEAAITVLSLQAGRVPPTAGLEQPEDPTLGHVMGSSRAADVRVALSSSFGFGGMGCVLVFEHERSERRVSAVPRRRFVVTGTCAIGSLGVSVNEATASYLEDALPGDGTSGVPFDPLGSLDPDRSRRFDRSASLVTLTAERALAAAGRSAAGTGLIVGSAFGNVERSIRFLLRLAERGPKLANPGEFPHLVASAASGNASVYAGFDGPVFTVSERELSGESALSRALSLLELSQAEGIVSGAAEARDAIVERVLGPLRRGALFNARTEGAAFLTIEEEAVARQRGARVLARILAHVQILTAPDAELSLHQPKRAPERGAVVHGIVDERFQAAVAASPWAERRARALLARSGFHEALGAMALASAVGLLAAGAADEVLVLSGAGERGYLTHLSAVGEP